MRNGESEPETSPLLDGTPTNSGSSSSPPARAGAVSIVSQAKTTADGNSTAVEPDLEAGPGPGPSSDSAPAPAPAPAPSSSSSSPLAAFKSLQTDVQARIIIFTAFFILLILFPVFLRVAMLERAKNQPSLIKPDPGGLYAGLDPSLLDDGHLFAVDKKQYVFASEPKKCPFIISVPHGGLKELDGVPTRKEGVGVTDDNTMLMGVSAYRAVMDASEGACVPCLVAMNVKRTWVDVNRGPPYFNESAAYDQPQGKEAWLQFQDTIERCMGQVEQDGYTPFLVDLHGNSYAPFYGSIIVGTGTTLGRTTPLLSKHGLYPSYLQKPRGILFELDALGFNTSVTDLEKLGLGAPGAALLGGYTILRAGIEDRVDSIQLEFSFKFRASPERAAVSGQDLGLALWRFAQAWPPPPTARTQGLSDPEALSDMEKESSDSGAASALRKRRDAPRWQGGWGGMPGGGGGRRTAPFPA